MIWPGPIEMDDAFRALACAGGSYALGCFTTGYYLVRAKTGQDIRTLGSGNIGARNVGRVLGRSGFFLTMAGDFAKGALAVLAVHYFTEGINYAAIAMLAVVVGHVWPVNLNWRGGKGVATSFGALISYDWQLTLAFLAVFAVGLVIRRRTVLPGLVSFLVLPAISWWLHHHHFETMILATLAGLILFAHRQNLIAEIPWLARRNLSVKPQHPKS
jgi:acyl phosphate:glycerol-3-phosphate acyltransferase